MEPDLAEPRPGGMRFLPLPLLLVLSLAACGGGAAPSPTDEPSIEGSWQLASGRNAAGDIPIVPGWPITLSFEGTAMTGTAACNSYAGRLVAAGGRIHIEELGMTAMGCEPNVMESESAYSAALAALSEIRLDGQELVLIGPDVELRFTTLPPPPTADLVDTQWVLETVVIGDVAAAPVGERATFEIHSDGTFAGSTGCRSFTGTWIEQGERIRDTSMQMDGAECAQNIVAQDSSVVSVVGDGFVPSIEGGVLTLTDPGGAALVYRAGE